MLKAPVPAVARESRKGATTPSPSARHRSARQLCGRYELAVPVVAVTGSVDPFRSFIAKLVARNGDAD